MQSGPALLGTLGAVVAASLVAFAASQGSLVYAGLPVFALCIIFTFAVQWVAFVPAFILQTEHFYDLTGALTYLSVVAIAFLLGNMDPRSVLLGVLVSIWAIRLGSFLFARVRRDGFDRRFHSIKPHFATFLMTWTLQGLWVSITLACGLAAMTSIITTSIGAFAIVGSFVWLAGFAIEVIADREKKAFRADAANKGRFISSGLWAWSRHPNYLGEIVIWIGIAIIALPALSSWQLVTLISPVFVYVLLTRISGARMLELRADKQWGDDPEYQAYKARTPLLAMAKPAQ